MKDSFFYLTNRQSLVDARQEARQVVLLVDVKDGKATLRSATDLKPARSFTMSIPYRPDCAYALANGECISCS